MASTPRITPRISILVCGRTGVGKSSLINYILGKDVCKVGDPADYINTPQKAFCPGTAAVKGFDGDMHGVKVTVYDSPGLQDGLERDWDYVEEMHKECHNIDLVLYCHDITEIRWTDPEMKSLRLLTAKFGSTFWNKTILAFTKANCLKPSKPKIDEKEYLETVAKVTEEKFWSELKVVLQTENQDQPDSDCNPIKKLPTVLTGSEREQILPTGPFIGKLWTSCLKQLSLVKVSAFIKATNSQSRIALQSDIKCAHDHETPGGILEFPTKDDLTEAWKVMLERRKKLQLTTNDEEELEYLIYLDQERQEQIMEKLRDGVKIQGNESVGLFIDSIEHLLKLMTMH